MNTERYNRQLILRGFGAAAQTRLANAAILVIGAGGLGCPALQYLAAAGVGKIGVVDDDVVSLSNLHRQILYQTEDVGKLKAEVAVKRLLQSNPEITIKPYLVKVDQNNILPLLKEYDFIFDGTDNFASRYLINDACALLQKPLFFAAVSGYEGQLAIFNVADEENTTTNYRDIFPVQPKEDEVLNCAENGVLGVLPGIIGTMVAAELIKFIAQIGSPLVNRLRHYNMLNGQQYQIKISPGNDYTLPGTAAALLKTNYMNLSETAQDYTEINGRELQALMEQPSTLLIDVRERHEFPKLQNDKMIQVPMSEMETLLNMEPAQENIVFICQHGIRSITAAEAFHKKYGTDKKIYSLKGGIVKWSNLL